jgi:hypothetical protein
LLGRGKLAELNPDGLLTLIARLAGAPRESLLAEGFQMSGTPSDSPLLYEAAPGEGFAVGFNGRGKHLHVVLCSVQDHHVSSTTGTVPMTSSETIVAELPLGARSRLVAIVLTKGQETADRDSSARARLTRDFASTFRGLRKGPLLDLQVSQLSDSCGTCRADSHRE